MGLAVEYKLSVSGDGTVEISTIIELYRSEDDDQRSVGATLAVAPFRIQGNYNFI